MQVYRHGDRTPLKSYPNDPYNNESVYWPQGPGQLTDVSHQNYYSDDPSKGHVRFILPQISVTVATVTWKNVIYRKERTSSTI